MEKILTQRFSYGPIRNTVTIPLVVTKSECRGTGTVGCLRRVDSGLVFKYEARPERHPNVVSEECAKSRARTFRSLTEITFRSRLRFFFRSTKNHKFKYIDNRVQLQVTHYRGVENGASRAQQHTGQVRLPGITANTPAPTAVNNNGESCCPGIRF